MLEVTKNLVLELNCVIVPQNHDHTYMLHVKKIMEDNWVLSRDLLLCEQDIHNVVGKLSKKIIKWHDGFMQS